MIELNYNQKRNLDLSYDNIDNNVLSCMQDYRGQVWCDKLDYPTIIIAYDGFFAYIHGDTRSEIADEAINYLLNNNKIKWMELIPQSCNWNEIIEKKLEQSEDIIYRKNNRFNKLDFINQYH